MANNNRIVLGGVELPNSSGIDEIKEPNETTNTTLGGRRYTDFINTLRSWSVSFKAITVEDYQIIDDLYNAQYLNEGYHILQIDSKGVYAPAKLEIASNIKYRLNGVLVQDLVIILKEENAIS
jgi:hypothetical protein